MKTSKYFDLGKSQYELDFVDIDPDIDTRLFLDPYFISKCEFPFASDAQGTLRSYFEYLLALLRGDRIKQAKEIFKHLGETNDICLGMSQGKPRGKGMGPKDAEKIFGQLLHSRAIKSGVMEDIEDFRIFVPNVDKDKVSDMTANIVKKHLLAYTQEQCQLLDIPLTANVPSGMFWDSNRKSWENEYTERLVVNGKPILLVPKRVVSFSDKYTPTEYREHFVLSYLQNEHLKLQSSLVLNRKDGTPYVTKNSIREKENIDKAYLAQFTERYPEVFADFKSATLKKYRKIDGGVLDDANVDDVCKYLITKLNSIKRGASTASHYHNIMIGILELLLFPNLSTPKKEVPIHEGRKRIDITFNNSADDGFFSRLPNMNPLLPCPFVFVECKNYTGEIANPELDQMMGRFSTNRGRVGIIVCRSLDNDKLFLQRCSDTLSDGNGLIIPITDTDILSALSDFPSAGVDAFEKILESKYRTIALLT